MARGMGHRARETDANVGWMNRQFDISVSDISQIL